MSEHVRLDHTFFDGELRPHLGALLVRRGLISTRQLDEALAGKEQDERLGEALIRLGLAHEYDVARTLAGQYGLDFLDLQVSGFDPSVARLLDADTARELLAFPVRLNHDGSVVVITADPTDVHVGRLEELLGRPVQLKVGELSSVRNALVHAFGAA